MEARHQSSRKATRDSHPAQSAINSGDRPQEKVEPREDSHERVPTARRQARTLPERSRQNKARIPTLKLNLICLLNFPLDSKSFFKQVSEIKVLIKQNNRLKILNSKRQRWQRRHVNTRSLMQRGKESYSFLSRS